MEIEACVVYHLTTNGFDAYGEVPKTTGGEFVTIERTGGGETNHIERATLAVQSWADTMLDAVKLDSAVADAMESLVEYESVSACRRNGSYNYTNPATNKYRYQSVYEVIYYREAITPGPEEEEP